MRLIEQRAINTVLADLLGYSDLTTLKDGRLVAYPPVQPGWDDDEDDFVEVPNFFGSADLMLSALRKIGAELKDAQKQLRDIAEDAAGEDL